MAVHIFSVWYWFTGLFHFGCNFRNKGSASVFFENFALCFASKYNLFPSWKLSVKFIFIDTQIVRNKLCAMPNQC